MSRFPSPGGRGSSPSRARWEDDAAPAALKADLSVGSSARGRGLLVALAATVLCAASLALRWPGVAMYDSVSQFGQTLDGSYTDWHPPIMARTWALLNRLHAGTQPFFVLQFILWWGGLGLIAAGLARRGRSGACDDWRCSSARCRLFVDWIERRAEGRADGLLPGRSGRYRRALAAWTGSRLPRFAGKPDRR